MSAKRITRTYEVVYVLDQPSNYPYSQPAEFDSLEAALQRVREMFAETDGYVSPIGIRRQEKEVVR